MSAGLVAGGVLKEKLRTNTGVFTTHGVIGMRRLKEHTPTLAAIMSGGVTSPEEVFGSL
jgi:hypothetical protein